MKILKMRVSCSDEPPLEKASNGFHAFVQISLLIPLVPLLNVLEHFHFGLDRFPQMLVVLSLGVDSFFDFEEIFLQSLDFLIDLELNDTLVQDAILQILYLILEECKIALRFRKGSRYVLLGLNFFQFLGLL